MQIEMKKMTPPATLSSDEVLSLLKKAGQSPVFLSHAMRPVRLQDP
jgi:hypothetical protein